MNVYQVMNQEYYYSIKQKLDILGTSGLRSSVSPEELEEINPPLLARKSASSQGSRNSRRMSLHDSLVRSKTERIKEYLFKHQSITISMNNRYKLYWDNFMMLCVLYSVTSSLYFLAMKKNSTAADAFDLIIWAFFIFDFVLRFFSEYLDKKRRVVRNIKLIVIHYAKTQMFFDFFALIPLHFVGHTNFEHFLRLLRISRLRYFFRIFKILKISKYIAGWVYHKETRKFKNLRLRIIHLWEIFKQIIVMFYMTFFLACIWFYYIDLIVRREHEQNSFYNNFGMDAEHETTNFIKTWYFIFTTLVTVGYGDFYATNKYEMGFAIILLLAGPTWFAFMMGKSINIIHTLQDLSGTNNKLTSLQIWIFSIEEKIHVLPNQLKSKIFTHFSNYWKFDRLKSLQNQSTETNVDFSNIQDNFFNQLPIKHKQEIFDYLFGDLHFRYIHFFKFLGKCKYDILPFMKPFFYNRHEVVIFPSCKVNEIYFVISGQVEVGMFTHKGFETIGIFHKNLVLGDYYSIKEFDSPAAFRALNYLRGYFIPDYALKELIAKNDLNTFKYVEIIEENYEGLKDRIQDIMNGDIMTTEEKNFQELDRRKIFPLFKKISSKGFFHCYLDPYPSKGKCKVKLALKDVEHKIKSNDLMRKKLISQVKEKLVENILTRTK